MKKKIKPKKRNRNRNKKSQFFKMLLASVMEAIDIHKGLKQPAKITTIKRV